MTEPLSQMQNGTYTMNYTILPPSQSELSKSNDDDRSLQAQAQEQGVSGDLGQLQLASKTPIIDDFEEDSPKKGWERVLISNVCFMLSDAYLL